MGRLVVLGGLYLGLAGCSMSIPLDGAAINPPAQGCGAEELQHLIGQPKAVLDAMDFSQPLRVMAQGAPATMDFAPDRLNIETSRDGIITQVWCG
jgi:hypothetical protein